MTPVIECLSCDCGDALMEKPCPKSPRPCGHHCEHSWTHDRCCFCGTTWGEDGKETPGDGV